jgi:hypothetical protein
MIALRTFMKTSLTSACRHCRHYTPEGRRGGNCQQLSVPVQSHWKACSLAVSPFGPSWENLEDLFDNTLLWQEQTLTLASAAVTASERNAWQPTATTFTETSVPAISVELARSTCNSTDSKGYRLHSTRATHRKSHRAVT